MIPDFKTYIGESAWGDMRRRSIGEIIRKEDDVNNLDFDDFCKYLQEKYPPTGRTKWGSRIKIEQRLDSRNTDISILIIPIIVIDDFCKSMVAEYNSKLRKYTRIKISESILNKCENIKEMLGDKYNVKKYSDFHSIVTMDGEITNNNIAELADIFLHAVDDPVLKIDVNESAWGDMRKRSTGEIARREDDINNLSFDEFVEYLKNTYTSIIDPKFFQIGSWYTPPGSKIISWYTPPGSKIIGHISIPIEKNNSKDTPDFRNRMIDIVEDTQRNEFEIRLNKYFFILYPNEMVKTFKDKYSWVKRNDNIYDIYPIGEEITNQICVDVIDRLLSMVENPILKKNS